MTLEQALRTHWQTSAELSASIPLGRLWVDEDNGGALPFAVVSLVHVAPQSASCDDRHDLATVRLTVIDDDFERGAQIATRARDHFDRVELALGASGTTVQHTRAKKSERHRDPDGTWRFELDIELLLHKATASHG